MRARAEEEPPAAQLGNRPRLEDYKLLGDDIEVYLEEALNEGRNITGWIAFVRTLYEDYGYEFLEIDGILPSFVLVAGGCMRKAIWDYSTFEEKTQAFNQVLESLWR